MCNYRSKGEESEVPGHICQRGMDALCFFVLVLLVPLVPGGVGGVTFLSRPPAGSDFFSKFVKLLWPPEAAEI